MRAPVNRGHGSLEFNMTPMIDVTFLLIIFFILSSHFAQQELQLGLELPTATTGREPLEDQARRITVNVLADGSLLLGSKLVDREELKRRILFESGQSHSPGQDLEVRIRSDRHVAYRFVEPIMLACAKSGVWKVTFSVTRQ